MELLSRLNRQGMTIVMVTHSPESGAYAGRTLKIADGHLLKPNPGLQPLPAYAN
jgi:putative ABC transport system ATP-binding protein